MTAVGAVTRRANRWSSATAERPAIPTLQEVIDLTKRLSRKLDRRIGIYPETKHPTYHDSIGLSLEEPLVRTLRRNGLDDRTAKVFVQSFETGNLRELDRKLDVPVVQLLDAPAARPYDLRAKGDPRTYGDLATPAGLREISRYAGGVGPNKVHIVPRDPQTDRQQAPTSFVRDAHRAGLEVHPWTFRSENFFLPADYDSSANPAEHGDAIAEYRLFYRLGVDGVFSDFPDTAVQARRR